MTDNHPFWVVGKGWVDSAQLKAGQQVEGKQGALTVASLSALGRSETTYNLTVDGNHNYFAGQQRALVHNCTCKMKTIVEDDMPAKKADQLKGKMAEGYENIKEMLSRGKPGKNQHKLTGDMKGKSAADLPGSGKGRGGDRVIFSEKENEVIIHDITDYHGK